MRVLIIEDDKNLLFVLKVYIGMIWDYDYETAHNGAEAIEILREQKVDVIISGFYMPLMTGLELRLKIESEFNQCPPFILFSGRPSAVKEHYKDLFHSILEKKREF